MKHIKLFEEIINMDIHSENTNIKELKKSFISDIEDICLELEDIYPIIISFFNPHRRNISATSYTSRISSDVSGIRLKTEYPSISIIEGKWRNIYSWEEDSRIWTKACINTANRIKDYLGDNYKLFLYKNNGDNITTLKPDLFEPKGGKFSEFGGVRFQGFEIVYDPKDYMK